MTLTITVPEEIAQEIVGLSEAERETFVVDILSEAWREAARWDAQIEADILAGKFDKMGDKALAASAAGRTLPAPSFIAMQGNTPVEKVP